MPKRPTPLYDFTAFGAAIKAARNEHGESRMILRLSGLLSRPQGMSMERAAKRFATSYIFLRAILRILKTMGGSRVYKCSMIL